MGTFAEKIFHLEEKKWATSNLAHISEPILGKLGKSHDYLPVQLFLSKAEWMHQNALCFWRNKCFIPFLFILILSIAKWPKMSPRETANLHGLIITTWTIWTNIPHIRPFVGRQILCCNPTAYASQSNWKEDTHHCTPLLRWSRNGIWASRMASNCQVGASTSVH